MNCAHFFYPIILLPCANTALPDPYPSSRQERLRDGYDSTPDPAYSCLRCSAQRQTATWLLYRVLYSLLAGCSVCHFAHARPMHNSKHFTSYWGERERAPNLLMSMEIVYVRASTSDRQTANARNRDTAYF